MAIVRNLATVKTTADITSSATSIPVNRVDVFGTSQTTLDKPFYVTIMPASGDEPANSANSEIVLVTGISGLNLTVTRGQRSTTAKAFNSGAIVTMAIYAEDAVLLGDEGTAVETPAPWVESSDIKNGAITSGKIADRAVKSDKIDWATLSGAQWPLINTATSNKNINNKADCTQYSFTVPANGRYFVSFTQQLGSDSASGYGLTLKIKLGSTTIYQSGAAITGNAAYMYGNVSCVVSANAGQVITCTATGGSTNSTSTANGRVSLARIA